MAATKYDFNIEQGSSFRLSLTYKDNDGNPIDLTNWCARLILTTDKNINQTFITTNLDYGVYKFTIDAINGKLILLIPAETSNNFNFNTAKYDLELQNDENFYNEGGKEVIRLLYGDIKLNKRYSKTNTLLNCDI